LSKETRPVEKHKKPFPTRTVTVLILVLICCGSWYTLYARQAKAEQEYAGKLQSADDLYEKQIYDEALELYEECLETKPKDPSVRYRIAQIKYQNGQYRETISECEKVRDLDPDHKSARILEARAYAASDKVAKAIKLLQPIRSDPTAKRLLQKLDGLYDLEFLNISEAGVWWNDPAGGQISIVTEHEKQAIYTSSGKRSVTGSYTAIGLPSSDGNRYPAVLDDQYCYIDTEGNRRLVPEESYAYLGPIRSGVAPAALEDRAGYLNADLQPLQFDFERAYPFEDGYALIKKDGTYHIIDSSFNWITDCEFTSVVVVDGCVCRNGVILGQVGEKWRLYNPKGVRLGTLEADELRFPEEEDGWIAYRSGTLWGFALADGTIKLDPAYEDARSFSQGYAAVKTEEGWGYIDTSGTLVIAPEFKDAGAVSREGTAWVANSAGYNLLKLKKYQ